VRRKVIRLQGRLPELAELIFRQKLPDSFEVKIGGKEISHGSVLSLPHLSEQV
jgi:hypothetical protein